MLATRAVLRGSLRGVASASRSARLNVATRSPFTPNASRSSLASIRQYSTRLSEVDPTEDQLASADNGSASASIPNADAVFPPAQNGAGQPQAAPAFNDWSKSFHGLSTEPFSSEIAEILQAPIDPMDIEMKPDGLIYLPEIKYRRILNKAFGPGGWGLAPRSETNVGPKVVSREYGLVCLGRLVAIARGEQEYFDPSGIPTATEACKSNALMRCSKDLGIASELWDPRFIREFKAKHCVEVFAEHIPTKRKKKLWRRKDAKLDYPYKELNRGYKLERTKECRPPPALFNDNVPSWHSDRRVITLSSFILGSLYSCLATVSDTSAKDPSTDQSGPLIRELLGKSTNARFEIKKADIVPDDQSAIRDWVEQASQSNEIDWILTTGGTGFGIRDCTPEAISPLIERPAPGLIHLILTQSIQRTAFAALSRPVAGVTGRTLVLTLPGSPKAVRENLSPEVMKVVQHGLSLLQGGDGREVHQKLGLLDRSQAPISARQDRRGGKQSPSPSPTHVVHRPDEPVHVRHRENEPIKPATPTLSETHDHHASHHHNRESGGHDHVSPVPRTEQRHLSHDPTAPVTSRHRLSPYPMISFEDAVNIVLQECQPLDEVEMKVDCKLAGHVLAEDVFACQNVPNTFTTNVDGYALRSDQGPGTYRVVTPATHPLTQKLPPGTIMRVNTGAPIPFGTNAVIMVEDTQLESTKTGENGQDVDEETVKTLASVEPGENVRKPGSDVQTGERVCEKGDIIDSIGGEIGTLTFVGQNEVKVIRKPVVALLSTGNELIDVQATQASGTPAEASEQWTGIYDTNRPSLRAALECLGYEVIDLGIAPDTVDAHLKPLKEGLEKADLIISTGGTSMGATDLLKPLIERNLNGKIHFGRVAIKPGKPTTFATVPGSTSSQDNASHNKYIFALPGNPASALVMFWMFVVPALRKLGGYPLDRCCLPKARVVLRDDMPLDPRPEFHRAIVKCTPSGLEAFSTGGQRSSRVASLAGANAFVALPSKTAEKTKLSRGTHADAVLIGELRV